MFRGFHICIITELLFTFCICNSISPFGSVSPIYPELKIHVLKLLPLAKPNSPFVSLFLSSLLFPLPFSEWSLVCYFSSYLFPAPLSLFTPVSVLPCAGCGVSLIWPDGFWSLLHCLLLPQYVHSPLPINSFYFCLLFWFLYCKQQSIQHHGFELLLVILYLK